ncbi:hypothetical protein JTE90_006269 [Oedothorax gibbosus]|uniref:Gag-pol polyprotein n=1 Tax=Oedothorax gibbosus TaxID=931172 RepID=A0AAV6U8E8_9ARAC|nr:hypothetical protein JTE90_006269 [Oedothorax gibbosus]
MVYGSPIRLPGEFLTPASSPADPTTFVGKLREAMQQLTPAPTLPHRDQTVFVSKDLETCSHIFLRTDSLRRSLQPPYEGPFKVMHRGSKVIKIFKNGSACTVNIDRVKPAYIAKEEADYANREKQSNASACKQQHSSPQLSANLQTSSIPQAAIKTRSGRTVRFNPKYS